MKGDLGMWGRREERGEGYVDGGEGGIRLSEPEMKVSVYRNLTRAPGDLLVSGCGFEILHW